MSVSGKTLFITGSSGFIGRHLLEKLNQKLFDRISCLTRTGELPAFGLPNHQNIRIIKGGLFDAEVYAEPLAGSDTVLHLAAVTGKAKPEEFFRVNAEGTEVLLHQCERVGVKNFIYVSTIATKFPDISNYYYAQSKKIAEDMVKKSNLRYSIVRPTIVIGKDGPIWHNLSKMSKLPFPFIFGDGKTEIQPIYVEDLVNVLLSVIENDIFLNEIYDLGGPEIVPFEEFIQLVHLEYRGNQTPVRHVPLKPLVYFLKSFENYFPSFLPVTTGQLSPFRFNSVGEVSLLHEYHASNMRSLKEMIRIILDKEKKELILGNLAKECKVFCNYLSNMESGEYVSNKYIGAHVLGNGEPLFRSTDFDRFLVNFSQRGKFCLRLVDSYTRFFSRNSAFRKKLILLLAILESTYPYHEYIDSADSCGKVRLFASLFAKLLIFPFYLLLSALVLSPFHFAFGVKSRPRALDKSSTTEVAT